jgi:hypothetical protein
MSEPVKVNCTRCGNPIGEQVEINGIILFHAGGALNREQRGWCAQCGLPFYWYIKDTHMMEAISVMRHYKHKGD